MKFRRLHKNPFKHQLIPCFKKLFVVCTQLSHLSFMVQKKTHTHIIFSFVYNISLLIDFPSQNFSYFIFVSVFMLRPCCNFHSFAGNHLTIALLKHKIEKIKNFVFILSFKCFYPKKYDYTGFSRGIRSCQHLVI